MAIIDTHCHLDHEQYLDDIDLVLQNAKDEDIESVIIPGADPTDLPRAVELCEKHPQLFFAVGVHPYDCENYSLEIMEKYVNHPKCVAIGECGLDYFRLPEDEEEKKKNIALQKEVFLSQIEFAKKVNKPLIVHVREASNDSKIMLVENDAKQVGGVLHCYNASEHLLDLSEHNFYFGIGGVVTFKNAKKLVQMVPKIPKDKLILETDGPYLTPHPHRGTRNEPKYTKLVANKIAELLDLTSEEIENITTINAKKLFKL